MNMTFQPSADENRSCFSFSFPNGIFNFRSLCRVPEDYFLAADGDYFYVSTIELPWAQAQYECLARKGHLAELDGM